MTFEGSNQVTDRRTLLNNLLRKREQFHYLQHLDLFTSSAPVGCCPYDLKLISDHII